MLRQAQHEDFPVAPPHPERVEGWKRAHLVTTRPGRKIPGDFLSRADAQNEKAPPDFSGGAFLNCSGGFLL